MSSAENNVPVNSEQSDMTSDGGRASATHTDEQQPQQLATPAAELDFQPPFQFKSTKKTKVPGNEKAHAVAKRPGKKRYTQFLNRQKRSWPNRTRGKPGSRSF